MSKTLECEVRVADVFISRSIKALLENRSFLKVADEGVEWSFEQELT
jgi:hypothetical protein